MVLIVTATMLRPGDAPWIYDEPLLMEMAIQQNATPSHFLHITLPFTPATHGLKGTRGARSSNSRRTRGLRGPCPVPIGAPQGIRTSQPASRRRRQRTQSSVQYGRTWKPSLTSSTAASTRPNGSGCKFTSSPTTSSFMRLVSNSSRAMQAVFTASRAARHLAVLGRIARPVSRSRF